MVSFCLKCGKNAENKNPPKVVKSNNAEQCFHENVRCVIVKK